MLYLEIRFDKLTYESRYYVNVSVLLLYVDFVYMYSLNGIFKYYN